jgi:hypothetical protein
LQAYGVLDKYKISKTFFVKTDQAECAYLDTPPELEEDKPDSEKRKRKPQAVEPNESYRSTIPDDANTEIKEEVRIISEKAPFDSPNIAEEVEKLEQQPIETVPERILKIAEAIKEESGEARDKMIIVEVKEENVAENTSEEKSEAKETEASA